MDFWFLFWRWWDLFVMWMGLYASNHELLIESNLLEVLSIPSDIRRKMGRRTMSLMTA